MLQMKSPDWLSTCLSWVSWKLCGYIPTKINGGEIVFRTIFSPANVSEKNGKIKLNSNFMKPPSGPDEDDPTIKSNKLSTTRYDYAGIEFCRCHARAHQSNPMRHYWGFGKFVVSELEQPCEVDGLTCSCIVEPKPVDDNPAHANINLGFRLHEGETLDSRISAYLKQLAGMAVVIKDPNPVSEHWEGDTIDEPIYGKLEYKDKT